ncbi:MAG: hypothetical protein WBA51_02215 [Erythrobacter sp.]
MSKAPLDPAEEKARQRYVMMNVARITSIAVLMIGIAGARGILPLPDVLGVVLAVAGMLSFFFAPPMLAKRWKAQDEAQDEAGDAAE